MNIVGLDPSLTASGLALADGSFATVKSRPNGDRMARLSTIRRDITRHLDFLGEDAVHLVVIEGYSMGSKQGAHQLGELGGILRMLLHDNGIPFVEVAPTRLKKWATGSGAADKDAVLVKAVRRFDPSPETNDQADAAWLRDMAVAHYSGAVLPKAKADLLAQVEWPAIEPVSTPMPWDLVPASA